VPRFTQGDPALIGLDLGALIAGAKFRRSQFEERLRSRAHRKLSESDAAANGAGVGFLFIDDCTPW